MFGYGSPKVQALIQKLDGADKCTNYIFKDFDKQQANKRNRKMVPPKKQQSRDHHGSPNSQPQPTKRFLHPPHRMPRPPLTSRSDDDSPVAETEAERRRRKRQRLLEEKEKEITRQLQELHEKLQYLKDRETNQRFGKKRKHGSDPSRQQKRKRTLGSDDDDEENEDMDDDVGSEGEQYEDEDEDGEDEDEDYEDVDDEEGEGGAGPGRPALRRRHSEGAEERGLMRLGRGRAGGSGRGGRRRSVGSTRGGISRRASSGKQPKLPIVIGSLTVHKIGALPSGCSTKTLDSFHNEKYLWPVGYLSYREYTSVVDPKTKSIYTCEILLAKRKTGRGRRRDFKEEDEKSNERDEKSNGDAMDDDEENEEDFMITDSSDTDGDCFPLFRVTPVDDPDHPAIATSATGAWMQILRRINDRKLDGEKRTNITVSGPYYFGFSHPLVAKLIQGKPFSLFFFFIFCYYKNLSFSQINRIT